MELNRRQLLVLTAVACAGCKGGGPGFPSPQITRTVDAGPESRFAADGVYDEFRNDGFFLVREGETLLAVSSVCTHRDCKLKSQSDRTFYCKCHGSRFTEEGKVIKGPATRDLPHYPISVNAENHLIVLVTRPQFDDE